MTDYTAEKKLFIKRRIEDLGRKAKALMRIQPDRAPSEWHAMLILLAQGLAACEYELGLSAAAVGDVAEPQPTEESEA